MVQPKKELQVKMTYDFTVKILSGSLTGRQFTGFFTYDPSTLQGEGEETILAEEVKFNYLSQYTRQKQHARLAFKNGTFQRMIWVDGKKTERFGFNAGFNRWQFGRPNENFIRQGQDYFGYLNPRTFVDGAGIVSYTLREPVLSSDSRSETLRDRNSPKLPEQIEELETVTEATSGVLLRCDKISGKLRIRVISEGYNPELNVQFPRSLREEGATYVVDEVELVSDRKFYRPLGKIRRLVLPKKLPLVKATGSEQDLETTIATLTTPLSFDKFVDWYPENATCKYELHNGAIVKIPLGTGEHSSVIGFMAGELHFEIRRSQLPYAIPGDCLLKPINDESGYQPDIIVLNKAQLAEEPRWQKESIITKGNSVGLAIEVVSTNWQDDYLRKVGEYELMGIPEYWIVDYLGLGGRRFIGDPKQPTLSVYQLVDGEYQVTLFTGNERIESLAFPELQLSAADIFAAKTITDT